MTREKVQEKIKDELLKVFDGDLSEETHNVILTNLTSDQLEEVAEKCSSRVVDILSDVTVALILKHVK